MNKGSWTPEHEKYVIENIDKVPLPDICNHVGRSERAVKLFLHRNKITVGPTVKRNLVKELLTLKFVCPEYFQPNRAFYKAVGINQMRWWNLYHGKENITETEYAALVGHFKVTLLDAFNARQLTLSFNEPNDRK